MSREIDAFTVDAYPEVCPICHHAIQAKFLVNTALSHPDFPEKQEILSACFRCPRSSCGNPFISYFLYPHPGNTRWRYSRSVPKRYVPPVFDERIKKLSPQFVQIYGQALQAGRTGLDEIHGVGLRKALEFLIKDYCIFKNPNKNDEIKKTFLGNCIKAYVTDTNIKVCAERATWLGNDETHYLRQWNTHDIKDLERLITLTCNWIVNEQMTDEYVSSMISPPKP